MMDGRNRTWREEGPLLTCGPWTIAPDKSKFVVLFWSKTSQNDAGATFSAKVVAEGLGTIREAKNFVARQEWQNRKAS